jgi:hypothetical protein
MAVELGSIDHLSQVISQSVAPSFLLGSVVGFISVVFARMNGVLDRIRMANAVADDDTARATFRADIPRLRRRLRLPQWSAIAAICSGASVTILIVTAFAFAMMGLQHVWGSAVLFIVSLGFVCVSLAILATDLVVAMNVNEHR